MGLASYDSLENAVKGCFGKAVAIEDSSYVGGGDINDSRCLYLSNGIKVFVKLNTVGNSGFFDAEETGLAAIASTGAIATPTLLAKGIDEKHKQSFLMMEMIERTRPSNDCWEVFGRELAAMHKADTTSFTNGRRFGFASSNFIGASSQINNPMDSWIEFFRQCRLEPQFKRAEKHFAGDFITKIIRFLDRLDEMLTEPLYPSLLHGDMWSGNIMTGPDGKKMLIDPAVYVGHAEADIAMTELFGRLPGEFYTSYRSTGNIGEGYEDRREIYNLYHLLNHLNLFGRSYLSGVVGIVERFSYSG